MNKRHALEFGRIGDYLDHWAGCVPDREALVLNQTRLTYAQYSDAVERCARALFARGVRPGDRVAMLSTPRPEYAIVLLGTLRIGAVWLGLNPRHRLPDLSLVVADAKPKALFALLGFENCNSRAEIRALSEAHPDLRTVVTLEGTIDGLSMGFEDFIGAVPRLDENIYARACAEVRPSDAAVIVYTSGSTGEPKGAVLSHRGFIVCYGVQWECWGTEPLRGLANLPINHVGSVGDLVIFCLIAGGTVVFMERFDPKGFLERVERERITFILEVPTIIQLVWAHPEVDDYDLSSVDVIVWGGGSLPQELIVRLQTLNARLYSCYGLTESVGNVTFNDDGADAEVLANTVGKPHPRYKLRLVDGNGNDVPVGVAGEILLRGDFVMLGYFERPEETAAAIDRDGWLHTGDFALRRGDGNLVFVGRRSEMYKSGGYNIYPREIESVIVSHSAVLMAAVVGVPDPVYTEVGHAFVVPRPGQPLHEQDINVYCRAHLANYKIPKKVHVVDDLPMLPIGKVDKQALKKLVSG